MIYIYIYIYADVCSNEIFLQSMRECRECFGMAAFDGCLFVAGGHDIEGKPLSSVEVFNPNVRSFMDR